MEFSFQWKIAESGYQWQELDGRSWLVYKPSTTWMLYQPLKQHTGLYRAFITIDDNHGMLGFATKYGLLGIGEARPLNGKSGSLIWPERVADWRSEILALRSAVRAWDAIQGNDRDYLKQVIKWRKSPKRVSYEDSHSFWNLKDTQPDGSSIKYGDLIWPAYRYIQDRINGALKDTVAPRMLWNDDNELKLHHVPKTLLGAMWLQFADAVSYNLEYRECEWCGKSFEVTRSTRSDRLYCSNSCRVSASRKRTRLAKRKKS
jgi:hypothetical protein